MYTCVFYLLRCTCTCTGVCVRQYNMYPAHGWKLFSLFLVGFVVACDDPIPIISSRIEVFVYHLTLFHMIRLWTQIHGLIYAKWKWENDNEGDSSQFESQSVRGKINWIYLTVGHFQFCYRLMQNREEKNYTNGFLAASWLNSRLNIIVVKLDTKLTAGKFSVNKSKTRDAISTVWAFAAKMIKPTHQMEYSEIPSNT